MDLLLIDALALKRLDQRCIPTGEGRILVCRRTGDWSCIEAETWHQLRTSYCERIRPSARLLRWSIWAQIPLALATLALLSGVGLVDRVGDALDAIFPGLSALIVLAGPLLAAAAWHGLSVIRALREIDRQLRAMPQAEVEAMPGRRRFNALEIGVLLFFGPAAFIDLYGSVFPHQLDGTPLMGRQLGVTSFLGLSAIVFLIWKFPKGRPSPMPEESQPAAITKRGAGVLARARREG